MPTYVQPLVLENALPGLLPGLEYAVYDTANVVLVSRRSTGLVEVGNGIYQVAVAGWDTTWSGYIRWTTSAGTFVEGEEAFTAIGTGSTISGASVWPTRGDVEDKLNENISPDGLTAALTGDIDNLRLAVIAEFQSPPLYGDKDTLGGTGRLFTATTETRRYTGNGTPLLPVAEHVPLSEGGVAVVVTANGTSVTGFLSDRARKPQLPWDTLVLPAGASLARWPVTAFDNIAITATWGWSLAIPADVWEAVRCEVARRAVSEGLVSLAGAGESVSIGSYNVNTAAGVSVWPQSSPMGIWEMIYRECVKRYRRPYVPGVRFHALTRRFS